MRRALGLVLLVVLLTVPAVAAFASEYTEYYKDRFKDGNYSGNEGTLWFEEPWYEQDPGGGGSSTGNIHVGDGECQDNNCLHLEGGGQLLESMFVKRYADLTMFETVELCFEMEVHNAVLAGLSNLSVQVSTNGGTDWSTLGSWPILSLEGRYLHPIYDLTAYRSEQFVFRFLVTEAIGVETFEIYIDTVEIKGTVEGSATSTSSTSTSSTSSTTSTTKPTTTTSKATTTTTEATTTTSRPNATTSTTSREESTTTSTTVVPAAAPLPPTPPGDGIRDTGNGLMADYQTGMMGDMDMDEVEVLGAELTANFSMAVEVFEAAKVWIAILALMITAAIVSGMDSRRTRNTAA